MRRREVIATLAGAVASWPMEGRAQQPALPVIGFLTATSRDVFDLRLRAFGRGLKEQGYVEGTMSLLNIGGPVTVKIDCRHLRPKLVDRPVSIIVAVGTPASLAAKTATTTIPIVFETAVDPVTRFSDDTAWRIIPEVSCACDLHIPPICDSRRLAVALGTSSILGW